MKRLTLYAVLMASAAASSAFAQTTPVTPKQSETYTEEVGKAVPEMKAPDGQAQHGPTKNVGDAMPTMKDDGSGSGATAGATGANAPAPQPPGTVTIYKDGQSTQPGAATGQAAGEAGKTATPPSGGQPDATTGAGAPAAGGKQTDVKPGNAPTDAMTKATQGDGTKTPGAGPTGGTPGPTAQPGAQTGPKDDDKTGAATGQAAGEAGKTTTPPAPAAGAATAVTPKEGEAYTKEVGKAVPTMKAPGDTGKDAPGPGKAMDEAVPPMKEGDAPSK